MRIKRGIGHVKRRKNLLKQTKGYRWGRKSQPKKAKVAVTKALRYAYIHRRTKKRDMRSLWQIRINAGAREHGLTYSRLIHALKVKNVSLDRKSLADLAMNHPAAFKAIIELAKS